MPGYRNSYLYLYPDGSIAACSAEGTTSVVAGRDLTILTAIFRACSELPNPCPSTGLLSRFPPALLQMRYHHRPGTGRPPAAGLAPRLVPELPPAVAVSNPGLRPPHSNLTAVGGND